MGDNEKRPPGGPNEGEGSRTADEQYREGATGFAKRTDTLQTAESSGTLLQTSLSDAIEQYEKDLILDALKSARGNRARAARILGTTGRIVNYKVRKYRIDWRRFRDAGGG